MASHENCTTHNDDKIDSEGNNSKGTSHNSSQVLEICQSLLRDYDSLSPLQVRQRLQRLQHCEQEACIKRELVFKETIAQTIHEERLKS